MARGHYSPAHCLHRPSHVASCLAEQAGTAGDKARRQDLRDFKVKGHHRKGFSSGLNVNGPRARGLGFPCESGLGVYKRSLINAKY